MIWFHQNCQRLPDYGFTGRKFASKDVAHSNFCKQKQKIKKIKNKNSFNLVTFTLIVSSVRICLDYFTIINLYGTYFHYGRYLQEQNSFRDTGTPGIHTGAVGLPSYTFSTVHHPLLNILSSHSFSHQGEMSARIAIHNPTITTHTLVSSYQYGMLET